MHNQTISPRELRKFGFLFTFVLLGVCGIMLPLATHQPTPLWALVGGIGFLIPAIVRPQWLKLIYIPWMKIGHILGTINTRIILGFIYFFLITPIGIIMRLCKKDPMERTYNKKQASYRKIIAPQPINHMERPF